MKSPHMNGEDPDIRLIYALAKSLPWVVVLVTLLTALITLIQVALAL